MEHLTEETLARLVDEAPRPEEAAHLSRCDSCRRELDELIDQTIGLRALPAVRPPPDDWTGLEARLASEGLVKRDRGRIVGGLASWAAFRQVAAGVVLFVGGVGFGAQAPFTGNDEGRAVDSGAFAEATDVSRDGTTLEEALASQVRAEARLQNVIRVVQQLQEQDQFGQSVLRDPVTQFAALETMIATNRAALRQSPTDPFLNQTLIHFLEKRDLVGRQLATQAEEWY